MPDTLFRDWEEVDKGQLRVPIGGKVYKVPPIGMRTGALIHTMMDLPPTSAEHMAAQKALDGEGKQDFYRHILGILLDELLEDDVPEVSVDRLVLTAIADFKWGRLHALKVWETGQDPKALAMMIQASIQILSTP